MLFIILYYNHVEFSIKFEMLFSKSILPATNYIFLNFTLLMKSPT